MAKDSKFRLIDYSEATQHFYDLGPNTYWNLTIEGLNCSGRLFITFLT